MSDNTINGFHPLLQSDARALEGRWAAAGLSARWTVIYRTPVDQAADIAAGASKTKKSYHEIGMAGDYGIFEADGTYVEDGTDPRYRQAADIAKAQGWEWGGDFVHQEPDWDHLEWHPGGLDFDGYLGWMRSHGAPA